MIEEMFKMGIKLKSTERLLNEEEENVNKHDMSLID